MLYAQIFKKLFYRLHTTGLHILIAALNAFHGFPVILLFPGEVIGQHIIKSRHSILCPCRSA